jgi:hypothetical protein
MIKMLVLVVTLFIMSGCSVVCDTAKSGTKLVATSLAARWSCDETKLFDYLVKPVGDVMCKDKDSAPAAESVLNLACKITTETLVGLGVDQIVSKFGCDGVKVKADLDNVGNLCNHIESQAVATPLVPTTLDITKP